MRRALATGIAALAMLALTVAPAAAAASAPTAPPAARPAVHKWANTNMRGIRLWGTWSRSGKSLVIGGRMRDTRKDGRWMRIQVEGKTASGRQVAQTDFVFNGGKRAYTTPRFQYSGSPAAHAVVRACILKSMFGAARGCGRWHSLF